MLGMRLAGSGALVDRLQAHFGHQSANAVTPKEYPFAAQIGGDLARPEERVFGEHPINLFHHVQRSRIDPDRRVEVPLVS